MGVGIVASLSVTSGSTGVSLCRQRPENSVLLAIRTRCALFRQYAKKFADRSLSEVPSTAR